MDDMVLEIFVLSVLRAGPVHGYELKRRVQRPSLTKISNNSLYPMLRRFEAAGLVTKTVEEQDGKPSKNVYAITQLGREHLTALVSSLPVELAASDEEFLVRLSFFNEIALADRQSILAVRDATLASAAQQVRQLIAESDTTSRREWRNLAMGQLLSRIESEQNWIASLAKKAAE
jgi:DNA-binding PadR family transcriptional regulator